MDLPMKNVIEPTYRSKRKKLDQQMNNDEEEKQRKYWKKYKHMKVRIKSLVIENAALCDEVAKVQENILIVKDERKYLLRKLLENENEVENSQYYYKNEKHLTSNGPRAKLKFKKRRSYDESGKSLPIDT